MRGIVAAGLVVVMALAGCTDEPEPRFEEPTESPSASESTSSAAEPEPWEERSKAGAVAFAKHWIDVFNDSMQSGTTREMRATSSDGCDACLGYANQIDDLYRSGGRLEGDGWVVEVASVAPGAVTEDAEVSMRITRSAQTVHDGKGEVKRYAPTRATYVAALEWSERNWEMNSLEVFK